MCGQLFQYGMILHLDNGSNMIQFCVWMMVFVVVDFFHIGIIPVHYLLACNRRHNPNETFTSYCFL